MRPAAALPRLAAAIGPAAAAALVLLVCAALAGCGGDEPAAPGVVGVLVERPGGVPERATGFVAADRRVVTVAHVLDGGGAVSVAAPGGARRPARVVRVDRAADLAVLEADAAGGRVASAPAGARWEAEAAGGRVASSPGGARLEAEAAGGRVASSPGGARLEAEAPGGRVASSPADARLLTARGGRVRAVAVDVRRRVRARVRDSAGDRVYTRSALELAGDVAGGDSGAPVLDADGRLLGVVFARSRRHDGTAYAVDAGAVDRLLAR